MHVLCRLQTAAVTVLLCLLLLACSDMAEGTREPAAPASNGATAEKPSTGEQADEHPNAARVTDSLRAAAAPSETTAAGTAAFAGRDRLQQALQRYRRIADEGGWPEIPAGDLLEAGDSSARVIPLRERLAIVGDLEGAPSQSPHYDSRVAAAVARFQRRHGLAVDSLVGGNTLAALNTPVQARIQEMEQTLQRMKALEADLSGRFVLVNIPEFQVRAYDDSREVLQMPVIVGQEYDGQATPVFNDQIEYLIFSPYWNIPQSIAEEEILPEARKDRGYLAEHDYEITSNYGPHAEVYDPQTTDLDRVASGELKLRQKPGPENALGLVKFMFPNRHAIYLHGTPADQLFDEATRAFSHGCIRVARPVDFAAFLLQPKPDWTKDRIETAMHNGEWQKVELDETVPVYIVYWTAFADDSGAVQFRPDLYDRYN